MGPNTNRQRMFLRCRVAVLALACLATPAMASDSGGKLAAFKGWEIYSWRVGGEWRFSLHVGTNRNKSCDEVRNPAGALGLDKLEGKLGELAGGEFVTWLEHLRDQPCDLGYPPAPLMQRLRALCRRLGLHLASGD